jgi:dTMP kinase
VTPDATVLLDVDPGVGAGRQRAAGKSADRMEREGEAFHRRVAAAYREHAARVAGIVRVDADAPRDQVQARVRAALASSFPETFAGAGFISQ